MYDLSAHATSLAVAAVLLAGQAAPFELLPGVVVDGGGRLIFVMKPESAVAVLDAATGVERCSTRHAAKPLLVDADRLLAQTESGGHTLRLRLFDVRRSTGAPNGACELVPDQVVEILLPPAVHPTIDQRIDGAFDVRASLQGSAALVEWSYRRSPAFHASQAERGAVLVDLATGLVERVSTAMPVARSRALPLVPSASPRLANHRGGTASISVTRRSDGTKDVEVVPSSTQSRTGPRALGIHDLRALWLSSDERSLLAASLQPGSAAGDFVWSIVDLGTGEKRGEVRSESSGSPFFAHDSTIVYREIRAESAASRRERMVRLVGFDLARGRSAWSYPVRDTEYHGTRPPRQPVPGR
jgi:hypothetical protein